MTELGVGAGQWGEEIIITPENLLLATDSIVVNLTDRDSPVFPCTFHSQFHEIHAVVRSIEALYNAPSTRIDEHSHWRPLCLRLESLDCPTLANQRYLTP